jgi:lipopolysaccharide export system protein LptA
MKIHVGLCVSIWAFAVLSGFSSQAQTETQSSTSSPNTGDADVKRNYRSAKDAEAESKAKHSAPEQGFSTRVKRSFAPKLDSDVTLDPSAALAPPDWNQPFRDIEADVWETQLGEKKLSLKGNVRLNLDRMRFSADEFWYDEQTNEMRAKGNVLILQDPAEVFADEIYYRVADPAETPAPHVLEPSLSEQERAKRRLSLGYIDALNVTVRQPGQELSAEKMRYDIVNSTGEVENAHGHMDMYYFGGKKLRMLGPASMDGEDIWVTTCDKDPPHYRVRIKEASIRNGEVIYGKGAQLVVGETDTPLYWPQWGYNPDRAGAPLSFDFDSGHRAEIGYYMNAGMQFAVTPDAKLGLRLFPTTDEGLGVGLDSEYDFMENPASPLFLSKGDFQSLYTTEDRGYLSLRHRQEIYDDTILLFQVEQWSDQDFYKDFFWDLYRNRTEPRSFANITHTKPGYIASVTVSPETNGFVTETEKLPEVTFHLLQREIAKNLYFSFDTINGYLNNEPSGTHAARSANIGRLTYDMNLHEALNLMPFAEVDGMLYSEDLKGDDGDSRLSGTLGVTLQTRLAKTYGGAFGFSGFKHLIVPSLTYSYSPESTMDPTETPIFDPYDMMNGRSRIETKIDNVVYGRDEKTKQSWQLGRLTLYQGNDFENEVRKMEDYEAELQLQPRPWWGMLFSA